MKVTTQMERIRANVSYDHRSVHFSKRAADKQFEVVARLDDPDAETLGFHPGQEVCLDVQPNRTEALESVRFFRNWENN